MYRIRITNKKTGAGGFLGDKSVLIDDPDRFCLKFVYEGEDAEQFTPDELARCTVTLFSKRRANDIASEVVRLSYKHVGAERADKLSCVVVDANLTPEQSQQLFEKPYTFTHELEDE